MMFFLLCEKVLNQKTFDNLQHTVNTGKRYENLNLNFLEKVKKIQLVLNLNFFSL